MQRLVNTLATLAAAVTLAAGLWQDWSLLVTLKRMTLSYLGFFFLGSILTLAVLSVPFFEKSNEEDVAPKKKKKVLEGS